MFSCEYCEIFKNTFLQNTTGELLLAREGGWASYEIFKGGGSWQDHNF